MQKEENYTKMTRLVAIVCFLTFVLTVRTDGTTLTEGEISNIKETQERFCGSDRMCSSSSNTEDGRCRTCPGCRCDEDCDKYGDCCADKAIDLLGSPNFHPTRYKCHRNAFKLISDRIPEFSFHSIQTCPETADKDIAELCVNPDPWNITLAIPAQTESEVYRNQYCAVCNEQTNYTLWQIKAECTQLVWLTPGMTSLQVIQSFVDDMGCAIYLRPPDSNFRSCYTPEEDIVSFCNGSEELKHLNDNEKLCHSYSAPIYLFGKYYRNVFCYFCTHGSLEDSFITPPGCDFDTPYPFSVILDPEAINIKRKMTSLSCECDPGYIYDKHNEECKKIECTADRILRDEACISVIRSANGLVYLLEVLLKPASTLTITEDMRAWIPKTANTIKNHMRKSIGDRGVGVGLFRVGVSVRTDPSAASSEIKSFSIHSKFIIKWESEIDKMESTLLGLRGSDWTVLIDGTNVTFNAEPVWTDPDDETKYPKLTDDVVDEDNTIYRLDHGYFVDLTKKHKALYVSQTLKCPRVEVFQDVDYTFNELTGEWQYMGTNESLDISQFEPSTNKSGFVCYSTFKENVTNCGRTGSLSPAKIVEGPLTYVSMFCQSLSLICLFLTFLVFCIFKSLRTLPGQNTMVLVFSLFVAIFLYTVGSTRVENQNTCKAIGISIHFFLLCSFTWMSICTVHMYSVFRNILLAQHSDVSDSKRFVLYLVISILVPAVIVGSNVAGNHTFSEGQDIGYGMHICYVSNFYTVLLAVGAPIAIVMIINGCLFAATVIALRNNAKQQEELKKKKMKISTYAKLSTLTGINWFFALVSVLVDSVVFKYIFVILCGLQGVYIFVSFACTRKVWNLFKDCCRSNNNTKGKDEVKVKMTFNGKELEIEELEQGKDPDYASISDVGQGKLSIQGRNDEVEEDEAGGNSVGSGDDNDSDIDSVRVESDTLNRACVGKDDETILEVDMHNARCDEGDYGLLMHATTKEIRDPCNVLFNPVFK